VIITGRHEQPADYYDTIYKQGYNTSGYYPLYQVVSEWLERIPSPRVLELGCGIGDLGRMIIAKGYPYRGFDFSPEAVGQSKKLCPAGNFFVGNVYRRDDYLPADYNVVIALEVLEHVDDLPVIENIPPGVRLIASVPDYDDVAHLRLYQNIQQDIIERYRPWLHVVEVATATANNQASGARQSIHIFTAIRTMP
jgi:2-polyprenyl-3-methyl-5-hydroxy-6-metoxy-1,4-benzoquinol methylase